ncbi:MAG: formyltransferase [Burkholderiales bacterium]|nr:formyltransferase [Burkholderiales bacterium]
MTRAVVFAYHTVGVRCLQFLWAQGVDVALVITHEDDPSENIWFGSVLKWCLEKDIACIAPADANSTEVVEKIAALKPDFLFSFYYRKLLKQPLLSVPRLGAFNMHGSLLPKYRGRAPVNWAVLHGETETGATLHQMNATPDTGPVVDQQTVPVLPDDAAHDVFCKVVVAAEICLIRALPHLVAGTAVLKQQDLQAGSCFGGRTAEDGRIQWNHPAQKIHNLVRAVSKPYPGAFSEVGQGRLLVWRTQLLGKKENLAPRLSVGCLHWLEKKIVYVAPDEEVLELLEAQFNGVGLHVQAPVAALNHLKVI